jgi:hypothetical protein
MKKYPALSVLTAVFGVVLPLLSLMMVTFLIYFHLLGGEAKEVVILWGIQILPLVFNVTGLCTGLLSVIFSLRKRESLRLPLLMFALVILVSFVCYLVGEVVFCDCVYF